MEMTAIDLDTQLDREEYTDKRDGPGPRQRGELFIQGEKVVRNALPKKKKTAEQEKKDKEEVDIELGESFAIPSQGMKDGDDDNDADERSEKGLLEDL